MQDFYNTLKKATEEEIDALVELLNADPNIKLELSERAIRILPEAFHGSTGQDSLESIFEQSDKSGLEIAYAGIIDEDQLLVTKLLKGAVGTHSYCDWEDEGFLHRANELASRQGKKVTLGHTHPVFVRNDKVTPYGPLCSKIYYDSELLKRSSESIMARILESELYQSYGADYCEMLLRSHDEGVSSIFSIMTPRLGLTGFFRVEPAGVVRYHPWRVL